MKETKNEFNPSQNLVKIEHFFKKKSAMFHFLSLSLFFAVLLIVFGQPVVVLDFTEQTSHIHPLVQLALTTVAGLVVLTLSRLLLYFFSNHHFLSPIGHLLWIMVELIVITATLCTIQWVVSGCGHLQLGPLAGDMLLGIIFVMSIPYAVSFLIFLLQEERHERMQLQSELDALRPTTDESDTTNAHIINFHNKGHRLVFSTEIQSILYIEAADNYTNIHYLNDGREDTYILHNTLKELETTLSNTPLLRCHRGYMVNIDNVRRLYRDGNTLHLELNGSGKVISVTKTYADQIASRLAAIPDKQ